MCGGVFKMLIYVQKFLEECCQNRKNMIMFSSKEGRGVVFRAFFVIFHFIHFFSLSSITI